jgi:hypothetical protein
MNALSWISQGQRSSSIIEVGGLSTILFFHDSLGY